MSYKPKKFDKPYGRRDNRDDNRRGQEQGKNVKGQKDNRNFLDRQRDRYQDIKKNVSNYNIRKTFEIVNEKMKKFNPKDYISEKYRTFSDKIKDPENKKLLKLLPAVLLAVTVLAVKNKRLIKPFIEAFYNSKNTMKPGMSMTDKALFLIYEYGKVLYKNADIFSTLDMSMSVLTLFLEDIPSMFVTLDSYTGISQFNIQKNIVKNAVELKVDLVDKPAQERKREEQLKKEKKEQQELRDAIKELKTRLGLKNNSKQKNTDNSNIILLKSIERLEKASSSKDNKKQGDIHKSSSKKGPYSTKRKPHGRR